MTTAQLIARKRDGEELSDAEIMDFIDRYSVGEIPDYQMSAFAMAVYFRGMTTRETSALTRAMLESGVCLQWPRDSLCKADKHSTGGIGDKISLVLAPVLACCGVCVPMLSGRGLGITGGTLDKLESIPGFRTDLTKEEIVRQTDLIGCAITGASPELAPADKRLYALRDVTGTVPSQPLIVASIMSKKLAESLDSLVLDVKFGRGAFMKSLDQAQSLARALVDVGAAMGVKTSALVTDMNQPLGRMVGNVVEVQESLDCLQGRGPDDVLQLTLQLGSELLVACGMVADADEGHRRQREAIDSGRGYEKFQQMVASQGGKFPAGWEIAPATTVRCQTAGVIQSIDNGFLGNAVISLGGGRRVMDDRIDPSVGFEMLVRVGDSVDVDQPLVRVFARKDSSSFPDFHSAFSIGPERVEPLTLVRDRVV